jgi:hypothetical protein
LLAFNKLRSRNSIKIQPFFHYLAAFFVDFSVSGRFQVLVEVPTVFWDLNLQRSFKIQISSSASAQDSSLRFAPPLISDSTRDKKFAQKSSSTKKSNYLIQLTSKSHCKTHKNGEENLRPALQAPVDRGKRQKPPKSCDNKNN